VTVTRTEPPTVRLQITTLGDLAARVDGVTVPVALAKSRELLVWLALHASGTRDEIVTALWDGSAEERHVEYFKVAVRRLRGALKNALGTDADPLPYREGRYRLDTTFRVEVDARLDPSPSLTTQELARQFQAFTQPFMPGSDSEWIEDLRAQCQQRAITLGLALAAASEADAPTVYRQVLHLDPWNDPAHQGLIHSLLDTDRQAEAEHALRAYRRLLQDEFGTAPPPEFLLRLQRRGLPSA
jgi:DNA-binding SARP family transcriptional activator